MTIKWSVFGWIAGKITVAAERRKRILYRREVSKHLGEAFRDLVDSHGESPAALDLMIEHALGRPLSETAKVVVREMAFGEKIQSMVWTPLSGFFKYGPRRKRQG